MSACKETFRPYVDGVGEFDYDHFEGTHPELCCELETCSEYSAGRIESGEEVAFLLVDPGHIDPVTGVVTPDAFDELFRRDLSIIRTALSSVGELEYTKDLLVQRGLAKNPPQDRAIDLVSIVSAEKIRDIKLDGERALGLYDTALPLQKAHGSVIARQYVKKSKLNRKKIRADILNAMTSTIIGYQQYRNKLVSS